MTDDRAYQASAFDAMITLRVLDTLEAALEGEEENPRLFAQTALGERRMSFRIHEKHETEWIQVLIDGNPRLDVAVKDLMPDVAENEIEAKFRAIAEREENNEERR
jgi:hypothetical protein